jgi:hypothetical protein
MRREERHHSASHNVRVKNAMSRNVRTLREMSPRRIMTLTYIYLGQSRADKCSTPFLTPHHPDPCRGFSCSLVGTTGAPPLIPRDCLPLCHPTSGFFELARYLSHDSESRMQERWKPAVTSRYRICFSVSPEFQTCQFKYHAQLSHTVLLFLQGAPCAGVEPILNRFTQSCNTSCSLTRVCHLAW